MRKNKRDNRNSYSFSLLCFLQKKGRETTYGRERREIIAEHGKEKSRGESEDKRRDDTEKIAKRERKGLGKYTEMGNIYGVRQGEREERKAKAKATANDRGVRTQGEEIKAQTGEHIYDVRASKEEEKREQEPLRAIKRTKCRD